TNATVGAPSQLSASSVTTLEFGATISLKHSTFCATGLLAVGLVTSSTLMVWYTLIEFPEQSVTLYVLVTVTVAPSQLALVISSLTNATVGAPSQLSASSVTTAIFGATISLKHSTFC